jgi:hypothetical protein
MGGERGRRGVFGYGQGRWVARFGRTGVFSFHPMEDGIGGRLIEPVFEDLEDYSNRANVLCYADLVTPRTKAAKAAWVKYRKVYPL